MLLLFACACAPPEVSRFPVVDGREGTYELVEREIPELEDPRAMLGSLGDGSVGGYLDLKRIDYRGGGPIRVRYHADGDVAVPLHDDAVVLWSYYHALGQIKDELMPYDIDVDGIFPIPFAYQPIIGGASLTASNAAYAGGGAHFFVLLADRPGADLPLAANPGVIRHEFGHALFQFLTVGDVQKPSPFDDLPEVRALNEGFADAVSSISLDDPSGFWDLSIPNAESRHLDVVHTVEGTEDVQANPYARGSVYASLAWALREQTDPETALALVMTTTQVWSDEAQRTGEQGLPLIDRWAQLLVMQSVGITDLCPAYTERFGKDCP